MADTEKYLDVVGQILKDLESLGFKPVLVGGMALVVLGSRRVTKDFDFLIAQEARKEKSVLKVFYKRGFELASRVNANGDVVTTINNESVAGIRLRHDAPESAYFYNRKTGLRIDLLFDFPMLADEFVRKAQKKKIKSYTFHIAAKEDLIQLKKIAYKNRGLSTDAQDLEFLKKLFS